MREIQSEVITEKVRDLCIEANSFLPSDVRERISGACASEPWPLAKSILGIIKENFEIAEQNRVPICQDTGVCCVFVEMGQEVHVNGDLRAAIDEGVRRGYTEGYLRKSVVRDPLDRVNTKDNTPAFIYYDIVPGDTFRLTGMDYDGREMTVVIDKTTRVMFSVSPGNKSSRSEPSDAVEWLQGIADDEEDTVMGSYELKVTGDHADAILSLGWWD